MRRHELVGDFICGHAFAGAFAVIDPVVVILTVGKLAHGATRMVGHVIDVGREKALVSFVHARRDISPPKEFLGEWRPIVCADLQFKKCAAGMEANTMHAFHASHRIMIAAPNGLGTVGMVFNFKIDRQEGCRAMMLRPIEFDAAGNPWTSETDEGRLDDGLVINRIVAVCFVLQNVNAAANFREDKRANKFVFDPDRFPSAIDRLFSDAIGEWQGIYFATAALVNAFFQEHRVFIRRSREISGNDKVFDAHLDCFGVFGVSVENG